jgi:hypothetical protein
MTTAATTTTTASTTTLAAAAAAVPPAPPKTKRYNVFIALNANKIQAIRTQLLPATSKQSWRLNVPHRLLAALCVHIIVNLNLNQ